MTKVEKILIGAHVPMTKTQQYLIGSVDEMIQQEANTFMIFSGPPQNTKRTPIIELNVPQMQEMLIKHQISHHDLVIHAPYIINLANQFNWENWKFGVEFFTQEVKRAEEMKINLVVLHPGSSLGGDLTKSLNQIVEAINQVIEETETAVIALETMSGKKNEIGSKLEELAYILNHVKVPQRVGICLDTCHLNDAGYDLSNWSQFKAYLDEIIGLEKIKVIHLNDSQNERGSHRDRHENIGYGKIGFDNLMQIAWDPVFAQVPKILETPLKKIKSAHHSEIKAIKKRTFIDFLKPIS